MSKIFILGHSGPTPLILNFYVLKPLNYKFHINISVSVFASHEMLASFHTTNSTSRPVPTALLHNDPFSIHASVLASYALPVFPTLSLQSMPPLLHLMKWLLHFIPLTLSLIPFPQFSHGLVLIILFLQIWMIDSVCLLHGWLGYAAVIVWLLNCLYIYCVLHLLITFPILCLSSSVITLNF